MKHRQTLKALSTHLLMVMGLFACTTDSAQTNHPAETGSTTLQAGGDVNAHGCKASAGYVWHDELASCIRPWISSAITLEVAPHRRRCTGMFEAECLLVRELVPGHPPQNWMLQMNEIAGFNPTLGVRYTVRVRKDRAEILPMDAPDTTYTLLRVLP